MIARASSCPRHDAPQSRNPASVLPEACRSSAGARLRIAAAVLVAVGAMLPAARWPSGSPAAVRLWRAARGQRLGALCRRPAGGAGLGVLFVMNIFPLLWSFGLSFFSLPGQPAGAADLGRARQLPACWATRWSGTACRRRRYGRPDRDRADGRGLPPGAAVRAPVPGPPLAADPGADADDALVRRGRRVLPLLLRATFGLVSQAARCSPASPDPAGDAGRRHGRHHHGRRLDVVAVRHAAGPGRPGSVPKYLYEAAEIDRATWWRKFRTITFPYIRGLLLLALLFRTIEAFKMFDLPFLLTNGGPGTRPKPSPSTCTASRSSISGPAKRGAGLHRAVHRHRADQSLSLLRQPPRRGRPERWRRRRPIGEARAGAGRLGAGRRQLRSISSRSSGSSSPPSRPTTTRWRCRRSGCSRRRSRISSRSSSAPTASARSAEHRVRRSTSSTRSSSPASACCSRSSSARSPPTASRAFRSRATTPTCSSS